MQRHLLVLIALWLWLGFFARAAERPNVIVIYTDDQGSVDMGCYGAKDLETPNMDALAARGVRFTQFYSAAPVCSPSRAAMLTGRYPQRAGLGSNASSTPGGGGMPAEQVTMAEMFKAAGYATGHFGKWHLGYTPELSPNAQGFDYSIGHMGGCIDNYSHFFYWAGPNRHDLWLNGKEIYRSGEFFPTMITREAADFIERNAARPFFVYLAMNDPHYPYQGSEKWLERYKDLKYPRNLYAAFVSTLDEQLATVFERLDKLGLREKTIVILQSDNGHSTEERAHFGGGSAGPYRGAKFSLFEGGIRLPAIISYPAALPQGEVRGQLATACDWMPTVAELTGVELPKCRIDGQSLVPVIRSAQAPTPQEVFHWQTGRNEWAVRQGDWKLLGNPRDTSKAGIAEFGPAPKAQKAAAKVKAGKPGKAGKKKAAAKTPNAKAGLGVPPSGGIPAEAGTPELFLVDLSKDIGEKNNVAAQHPDVTARLKALHEAWAREVQTQ